MSAPLNLHALERHAMQPPQWDRQTLALIAELRALREALAPFADKDMFVSVADLLRARAVLARVTDEPGASV